jgi:hypothetical protein
MQFPGDKMDADHEPHWLLLSQAGSLKVGGGTTGALLFKKLGLRDDDVRDQAYTILLSRRRHALGRTYGGKSHGAAETAIKSIRSAMANKDEKGQRAAVIAGLKASMQLDTKHMRDVIEQDASWDDVTVGGQAKAKLVKAVRKQIEEGLKRVEGQPLSEYSE